MDLITQSKKGPNDADLSDSEDIFEFSNPDTAFVNIDMKLSDMSFYQRVRNDKIYRMSGGQRGRCLIINNYKFKTLLTRCGAEMDVMNLATVLRFLRFHVIIKQNIEGHEFDTVLSRELQHPDHEKLGMFGFILMSHGGKGNKLYGTDDAEVDQHALFKRIYDCEILKNKPKFIVVQACAGDDLPKESHNNDHGTIENLQPSESNLPPVKTSTPEDVLFLKSAFDGFVSVRDSAFGSPFIRALVEALYKHAHNFDLETLCKQVQNKVRIFNRKGGNQTSLPSINSFLRQKIYLFPGITSDDMYTSLHRNCPPNMLQYKRAIRCGGDLQYVECKWISDESLLLSFRGPSNSGLEIRDSNLKLIEAVQVRYLKLVTSYADDILVFNSGQFQLYSQKLDKKQDLFKLPEGYQKPIVKMAAIDGKIFALVRYPKSVCIWSFNGENIHTINLNDMENPTGICTTGDGCLLISNFTEKGSVCKYLAGADYSLIWKSDEVEFPYGISEQCTGLIYVSKCSGQIYDPVVYVMTSTGQLMKKLKSDASDAVSVLDISVSRDFLASVSTDGMIQLFTLKYDQ